MTNNGCFGGRGEVRLVDGCCVRVWEASNETPVLQPPSLSKHSLLLFPHHPYVHSLLFEEVPNIKGSVGFRNGYSNAFQFMLVWRAEGRVVDGCSVKSWEESDGTHELQPPFVS